MTALVRDVLLDLSLCGVTFAFDLGQLYVTRPAVAASASKLAAALRRLKEHRRAVVADCWCPKCERDVRDDTDRERLVGVNPFCCEGGCPYRCPKGARE